MFTKIKNYFDRKNSYGISRKDQIIRLIKSTSIEFYSIPINKERIINAYFVIEDLQGDIDIILIFCVLGKSVKIKWYCYVDWWRNNNSPYIVYWKMIGKRYWEK